MATPPSSTDVSAAVPVEVPAAVRTVDGSWRRNLVVVTGGSFTTIVAMTLLLPYLPLYVAQLGADSPGAVVRWSGIAYAATFVTAALTAPLWGALGDRYGRKPMLIRASLGMAVAMSLIGLAQDVWQLVALRLLVGLLGGYASGSTIMVAAQTPKDRSAWALGVLSSGVMAGNLVGPLVGGFAPDWIGIRATFFASGALIFLAFLATAFWLREERAAEQVGTVATSRAASGTRSGAWAQVPLPGRVVVLLATASLLALATTSIEPIVTVYVRDLTGSAAHVAAYAGILMALTSAGSIVSAPRAGRLADRVGHTRVVVGCLLVAGALLLVQAAVTNVVELGVLRLLMGIALGGLMPSVTAAVRHLVPGAVVGRILGYGVSAQYAGQVVGPVLGGVVGASFGMRSVFVATGVVLLVVAALNVLTARRIAGARSRPQSSVASVGAQDAA
jgi:MFS family permease